MRVNTILMTALALSLGLPAAGAAQGPSFDCTKADGAAQTLICSDAALAARDRTLDGVYKAAVKKATGPMLAQLRAEQRGWVKGRDECWKTSAQNPSYLTASWTASSLKACIDGQYRLRTSELQAVWRIVTPKPSVSCICQDNPANEIVATFFETDPLTARLERGDRSLTVWLVETASGAAYEGQNVTFWSKGTAATATWMNVATGTTDNLKCRVR